MLLVFSMFGELIDPFGILSTVDESRISGFQFDSPNIAIETNALYSACAQCGAQMYCSSNNLESICKECGCIVDNTADAEEEQPVIMSGISRLRLVGVNSSYLQPDLYKSNCSDANAQRGQIYNEYKECRAKYILEGGQTMPLDACSMAADLYSSIQQVHVKRSQNKKSIMAACFYYACLDLGFTMRKSEIAAFMQLKVGGIARGLNFCKRIDSDGEIALNIDIDPCKPEITTLFNQLELRGTDYAPLKEAVFDIVQTAIANNIGIKSVLRSKCAGAVLDVITRAKLVVPEELLKKTVKTNTAEKFTTCLRDYKRYFTPIYKKHKLE